MQKTIDAKYTGLIAGQGDLPLAIAKSAKKQGKKIFAVGLHPLADENLSHHVDEYVSISVGKLGSILEAFKNAAIKEAILAGKVPKTLIFKSKIIPDLKAALLLAKLRDKSDDTIMLAITDEFRKSGVKLLDVTEFLSDMLTPDGLLTKRKTSKEENKDIEFGFKIAKEIGRLDIGQTVVVKGQSVMAIEAIEGTDKAILRGGELAGDAAVVIKVSKPTQDKRFDYPVAGLDTLKSMKKVKARVLALEAQGTILLEREEMIMDAEEVGITIIGVSF